MLTQKAKYAIKALLYLAREKRLVRTQEIAEQARIPKKFLEAILLELKSHKVVKSVQGPGGGYQLSRDPEDISLADVYRIFEGPIALVPCASLMFYAPCADCQDEKSCTIRKAMIEIRHQTLEALQAHSIASMSRSGSRKKSSPPR